MSLEDMSMEEARQADKERQEYFNRFGDWPPEGRWDDHDEHMAKVRKALKTGKPIPDPDIPDDMLI